MVKRYIPENIIDKIKRHRTDFKLEFFTVGGNGGAGKDTSSTGCRIKDLKTGLYSEATEQRSQLQNRKAAFERLVNKLIDYYKDEMYEQRGKNGEVVRTYTQKNDRVVDHRLGKNSTYSFKEILDGKMDNLFKELNLNEQNNSESGDL